MIDAVPLIARCKSELVGLKDIGGSVEMDVAIEGSPPTPSLFVIQLADGVVPGEDLLSGVNEDITQAFGFAHVVSNRRDAKGAAAMVELTPLRRQLILALVGWVPDDETGEPMRYRGGRLLRLDGNGRLWWIDEFTVQTQLWSA